VAKGFAFQLIDSEMLTIFVPKNSFITWVLEEGEKAWQRTCFRCFVI